jgi:hypothetical protein
MVAIAVQTTALEETMLYPSCKSMWLDTSVRRIPALNQAEERID